MHRNREAVPEAGRTKTIQTGEYRLNHGTFPMLTFASRPLTASSTIPVNYRRIMWSDSKDSKCRNYNSYSRIILGSDFQSAAVVWIKEVEMVFFGRAEILTISDVKFFPNFEMLDAKIASARNKIIQNSQFKKKVSLEEEKAQKEDRILRGRQIAFVIYDYFRVTGGHDTVLAFADLFSVTLRDDNAQEFDTIWDEVLLSMTKNPSDDILESLCKLKIRESDQLKTVLEFVRHGDSSGDIGSQLTEVECHGEEEYRSETFFNETLTPDMGKLNLQPL